MSDFQPYMLIYQDKHFNKFLQNGIIVDSGVLLEFFKLIHKKNKKIPLTSEEKTLFGRLEKFLSIGRKYITPHILTELSNLIGTKICVPNSNDFCDCIAITKSELNKEDYHEITLSKEDILKTEEVNKFGVTDTSIILIAKTNNKIILTYDKNFSEECKRKQNLPTLHLEDLEALFLTVESLK